MFSLYPDTEKELFYSDYNNLPDLNDLTCTQIVELINNLYNAIDNAYCYHADMLCNALFDDIVKVNKKRCFDYLLQVSPGHMASVIDSTKYTDIDNCIHILWQYFNTCSDQVYFDIGTCIESIENLVKEQYNKAKQQERRQ
jgi:hypothetical protein